MLWFERGSVRKFTSQTADMLTSPFMAQVSPLFGTIYNSILIMAHAVHRVRESQAWMSGGNLAQRIRNLDFQVRQGQESSQFSTFF